MVLEILDKQVIEQIRSSSRIESFTQCVIELVLNSLDAKATSIAIRANLTNFRIQVVDNGKGINRVNLELVGQRYMTNKCHSLSDLQNRLKYYGFKGEALSSIAKISRTVKITSLERSGLGTFCKKIVDDTGTITEVTDRPSVGTTVTVEGFLNKLPVRQSCIKPIEFENLKRTLESLIIIHPKVSFSLRNDAIGNVLLNSTKTDDIVASFRTIHSTILEKDFNFFKVIKNKYCIQGVINTAFHDSKRLQYFYVNKRPIQCSKLEGFINAQVKKLVENTDRTRKYPILVLLVKCPYSDVDFVLEACKTKVFFKKYPTVVACVEKSLRSCLGQKKEEVLSKSLNDTKEFGVSIIGGMVKGVGVKRGAKDTKEISPKIRKLSQKIPNDPEIGVSIMGGVMKGVEMKRTRENTKKISQKNRKLSEDTTKEPDVDKTHISLFANFSDNEEIGKNVIMDYFMKSVAVFSPQLERTPQEEQGKISVGVQTMFEDLDTAQRSSTLLNPLFLNLNMTISKSRNRNVRNQVTESPFFQKPRKKEKLRVRPEEEPGSVLNESTTSRYFSQKKICLNTSKYFTPKKTDYFDFSQDLFPSLKTGFGSDMKQGEVIGSDLMHESFVLTPTLTCREAGSSVQQLEILDMTFGIEDRFDFVPKGLSPILKEIRVDALSPQGREDLQNAIVESYEDELLLIKWQNYIQNRDPKKFFEEMYLALSKLGGGSIPVANDRKFEHMSFTKDLFTNLEVIGQVDFKFVIALEKSKRLIILFDQHAVHERVRLEELNKGYRNASTKIEHDVMIFLPREELNLLKEQKTHLLSLGLVMDYFPDGINIRQVPLCIYKKSKKKGNLVQLTESLVKELIQDLKGQNGILVQTPKLMQNIVNSEACRGAVKFGDLLTKLECFTHLKNLAKCDLPFQCAHGRPTLSPLINIQNFIEIYPPKPLLINLRKY